jgi:hypothetical protein
VLPDALPGSSRPALAQAVAGNDSIFQIDPDCARRDDPSDVWRNLCWLDRIAALEIDAERGVDGGSDALNYPNDPLEGDRFTIVVSVCGGHRPAARCDGFRSRLNQGLGAASVPDVVEDDRITLHMKRPEELCPLDLIHHFASSFDTVR